MRVREGDRERETADVSESCCECEQTEGERRESGGGYDDGYGVSGDGYGYGSSRDGGGGGIIKGRRCTRARDVSVQY